MEQNRKKRLRSPDSSESDEDLIRPHQLPSPPVFVKNSKSVDSVLPKPQKPEIGGLGLKKPKLWESDPKKPSQQMHSGIVQCVKAVQESIQTSDFDLTLRSLKKLSNELTMLTDDFLSVLPLDLLTESLILALSLPASAEVSLQAIICIHFLIESHHNAVLPFVKSGVISHLTAKLINIEYIDLAEFAVKTLEKISSDFPIEVLRQGFLNDIFAVIDFFEIPVQKRILGIVLNVSKAITNPDDFFHYIAPCVPILINLIRNHGKEFLHQSEKSIEILIALNESMRAIGLEENLIQILVDHHLVSDLFVCTQEMSGVMVKILKLFTVMCRNSMRITIDFIESGLNIMKTVLEKGINDTNCNVLTECLQLINSIIPNENEPISTRVTFFNEHVVFIHQIHDFLIPNISAIYEILNKKNIKILYLDTIYNLIRCSSPEGISNFSNFSIFLSNLLTEKDGSIVKCSLKIISTLYDKIPSQISTSFIREGVVKRFKSLKHPENLKHVIEDKYSDPLEFEHFMINYRRTRAYSETQDIQISHGRPRLFSECRDTNYDIKKEIISLSKNVIDKHNTCRNKSALTTVKILKALANLLDESGDETSAVWKEFAVVIDDLNPTAYEFSSSLLADSIWKWLSFKSNQEYRLCRYETFLNFLTQHCKNGQMYFSKVLSLYMTTFAYSENSITSLAEKNRSRNFPNKAKFSMIYNSDEVFEEIESRHNFFSSIGKFTISPDVNCTVKLLKSLLLRVENKDDLSFFKESIQDEAMELEDDPELKLVKIRIFQQDVEVSDDALLHDLASNTTDVRVLLFSYSRSSFECNFSKSDQESFRQFLQDCSNLGLDIDNPAYPYLRFIKFLFKLSYSPPFAAHSVRNSSLKQPLSHFLSQKLNSIVFKQFHEPFSRKIIAQWVREMPRHSWFLFSYATRLRILEGFRFVQNDSYRVPKQKIKVDRENLLESAIMVMNDVALIQQGILEIQYHNEIGTGNGPTLEFFSLVSEEIRKLNIWRSPGTLFPSPLMKTDANYFEFIGKIIGKAIIDRRYVELPLSPVFWKLVLNKSVGLKDIAEVDASLFRSLSDLHDFAVKNSCDPSHRTFQGSSIEDLHLFFTLPGYDNIELKANGREIQVSLSNLQEYIELVVKNTLVLPLQIQDFRNGLSSLLPIESLLGFSDSELEEIVCGTSSEVWDLATLKSSIKPAHGYCDTSPVFLDLLKILSEMDFTQQKKFLQFATGCPRLPVGGFFGLSPCLTVVRKEEADDPDMYLPSVMTCQNYFKLPNYSNFEILKKNLFLAIEEGHQSFHLS